MLFRSASVREFAASLAGILYRGVDHRPEVGLDKHVDSRLGGAAPSSYLPDKVGRALALFDHLLSQHARAFSGLQDQALGDIFGQTESVKKDVSKDVRNDPR